MTRKVEETDIVMQEVETVSQQYLPLSTAPWTIRSFWEISPNTFKPRNYVRNHLVTEFGFWFQFPSATFQKPLSR